MSTDPTGEDRLRDLAKASGLTGYAILRVIPKLSQEEIDRFKAVLGERVNALLEHNDLLGADEDGKWAIAARVQKALLLAMQEMEVDQPYVKCSVIDDALELTIGGIWKDFKFNTTAMTQPKPEEE